MSDIWTTSWTESDAGNSQTPPEGWPAGMFPNAVEPAARMNMGAAKRFWNRINPVYAAQWNTADSYVVSPSIAPLGYGLYERWSLRFTDANVSTSPSVNISSLGKQLIKKYNARGTLVNPAAGDIQAQAHRIWWDGTQVILDNPLIPVPGASYHNHPANPTGTSSLTGVMMGLAGSITPQSSGKVLFMISGNLSNTVAGNGAQVILRYGTGSAPANGDAATGTVLTAGNTVSRVADNNDSYPFAGQAIVTGLVVGTSYWIDAQVAALVGNTGSINNVELSAMEFP